MQKNRRFDFRVSVQEKTEIRDLADLYGMTVSAYVRETALGYESISLIDIEKIEQLIQKNAELARLGNLLKIWLFNNPKYSLLIRAKIEWKLSDILDEIEKCRLQISEITESMFEDLKQKNIDLG